MRCVWRYSALQAIRRSSRSLSTTTALPSVVLRPYQLNCLNACDNALASGVSRIGVSLPTGAGKTTVFISLISRIPSPESNPAATRSLIIVNSIELARQAAAQAQKLFPHWKVEIEQGAVYKASGEADVTVATYQTLLQPERIAKFNPLKLKAIIIDEAHHAAAPSYLKLLSQFSPDVKHPGPDKDFKPPVLPHSIPIIGFSATFGRHDGLALAAVFEEIVYHRDFLEMIQEKWLCDVRFTSVRAKINLDSVTVNSTTGDFNPRSLSQVINTETINKLVVKSWLARAATRKSTLVFCVNVAHVQALTQTFRAHGVDARYVYSKTPVQERRALIEAFKAGAFPVLVNCAILTEGADIPNIDCVVVARPTRSRNVFAQMIGRGMRLSPDTGKEDCRIIDFVDSTDRVGGVISTPTLFGLDPSEIDVEDETPKSLNEKVAAHIAARIDDTRDDVPEPQSVTFTDHENPFSQTAHGSSGAPHVYSMSDNSWVGCGEDIYVLECLGEGFIRIERVATQEFDEDLNSDGWSYQASYTPSTMDSRTAVSLKVSPWGPSRKILTAKTLTDAIRGCDTYAKTKVLRDQRAVGLRRLAKWREAPATDGQKELIMKRWKKRSPVPDPSISIEERVAAMTKGEAANIITRLKHGAQGRYDKKAKAELKNANKIAEFEHAELKRRARETVRVGPLTRLAELLHTQE